MSPMMFSIQPHPHQWAIQIAAPRVELRAEQRNGRGKLSVAPFYEHFWPLCLHLGGFPLYLACHRAAAIAPPLPPPNVTYSFMCWSEHISLWLWARIGTLTPHPQSSWMLTGRIVPLNTRNLWPKRCVPSCQCSVVQGQSVLGRTLLGFWLRVNNC